MYIYTDRRSMSHMLILVTTLLLTLSCGFGLERFWKQKATFFYEAKIQKSANNHFTKLFEKTGANKYEFVSLVKM